MSNDFRVIIPTTLDDAFSIDNFKFSEIKGHLKYIFEVLQKMGLRMEDLDFRFTNKIGVIKSMEKTTKLLGFKNEELEKTISKL